jgi:hypothetical protein
LIRRLLPGLVLALGLLGPSCAEDEVTNPSGRLQLWIAQTVSGRVTQLSQGVEGATVTLQYSNNYGFAETPSWFPVVARTARTNSDGYYEFEIASWLTIEPPVQDDAFQFNVWLRYTAGKSGVGGSTAAVTILREASVSPPTGNLNPYQLTQNFVLEVPEP